MRVLLVELSGVARRCVCYVDRIRTRAQGVRSTRGLSVILGLELGPFLFKQAGQGFVELVQGTDGIEPEIC
jgi:hypothetical protein